MPRLGLGSLELSAVGGSGDTVTTIDDFFFESDTSGEVTPIYTASRKQFARNNNDVGINAGVTKDTSIAVPPGQTGTAIRVAETATTGQHFAQTFIDEVTAGDTYTMSLYVKSTYSSIIIYTNTSQISSNVTVNFTNETIATSGLRAGIEDAGGGWYRVNWTQVAQASGASSIYLVVKDLSSYAGNTSNFTDYFGMQVEQDSRASSFMLNTTSDVLTVTTTLNDTSEVWDFDGTDIMLEADPEDEGFWEEGSNLVLNHDYAELGSEEITNGNFSNGETNWANIDNLATFENSSVIFLNDAKIYQNVTSASSLIYKIVIDFSSVSGDGIKILVGNGNSFVYYSVSDIVNNNNQIVAYSNFIGTGLLFIYSQSANTNATITNVSVKQVDPNDRWSLTNTTISNGVLNFPDNSSAAKFALYHDSSLLEIGSAYEITLTVNKTGGGVLKVLSGTGASDLTPIIQINSSGTHTFIATNNTNGGKLFLYTTAGENFQGTVDNVTVREYAIQPQDV